MDKSLKMENVLITMSGGTTTVINATLVGIVEKLNEINFKGEIIAGKNGLVGFMNDEILTLNKINLDRIYHMPGSSIIGTSRTKKISEILKEIDEQLKSYNIKYFFNIGGNGTIEQTKRISEYCKDVNCISLPKTVDNDFGDQEFKDMWFTPGFPSIVNYWCNKLELLNNENLGAYTHDQVLIAQTFGRETGFITGSVRLADKNRKLPLLLLLPEDKKNIMEVVNKINENIVNFERCIVIITEGYFDFDVVFDNVGQVIYGSSKTTSVQELINACINSRIQARGINYTIDQRQNYIFRTNYDLSVAYKIGCFAVENMFNSMNYLVGYTKQGPKIIPLENIKNYSRKMKPEWIDHGNFDVADKYIEYLSEFITYKKNSNYINY